MSQQLLLEGIGEKPKPKTDLLFIGIFPPPNLAAQLTRLALELRALNGLQGPPLETGRFHITVHKLDHYAGVPAPIVANASQAATSIATTTQPFSVTFDRAFSFNGNPTNRPFVLHESSPSPGLQEFFRKLGSELSNHNVPNSGHSAFTPHITLLYDAKNVPDQSVQPITWMVREFALIHSRQGKTQHIPLGRWTLGSERKD